MERLFSPCTRLQDLIKSQGRLDPPEGLQELNLDVSTEELLSTERAFTSANLYTILGDEDKVAWLTPHVAVGCRYDRVVFAWRRLHDSCRFTFNADGKEIDAWARSPEHLLEISDVILRLLAASAVHSVVLHAWRSVNGVLNNAPTLAYLMEQCQSLNVILS
jgi:hypothetical protein